MSAAPAPRSATWRGVPPPPQPRPGPVGMLRAALRGGAALGLVGAALPAVLLLRGLGAPRLAGEVVAAVCRGLLRLAGLRAEVAGAPLRSGGALMANHSSWLDILAIGGAAPGAVFVAKAEVRGWPVVGALAAVMGTLFIRRDPREAEAQTARLAVPLAAGVPLVIFPEGTSSDGCRVLPFKSTLFAALCARPQRQMVQPVSLRYCPPPGAPAAFYGFWGETGFGAHALKVLGARGRGRVEVRFHPPLAVAALPDRKALAAACEAQVRAGFARAGDQRSR